MNRARLAAGALAAGRVAIGAGLVLAPRRTTRAWLGAEESERPAAQALARGLGIRDMVIGMIALHTLGHPEVGPRWQATGAVVDAVDCLATVGAARALPRSGVAGTVALAGGAALAGAWLSKALRA